MSNVGFIDLGIMGSLMAEHIIDGEHTLYTHSRSGVPTTLTDQGTIACHNAKEVARNADIIILMVPDTPHVEAVLFGENGVAEGLSAGKTVVALNIEAVSEALLFASKAGTDPAKVRKALMGGFASSKILEVHGERMVKHTFDPGFRIELHQKDLNLALAGARGLSISLPNTATAQDLFNSCAAHGGSAWDHSAMCRALEMMADHEIAK